MHSQQTKDMGAIHCSTYVGTVVTVVPMEIVIGSESVTRLRQELSDGPKVSHLT